MVTLARNMSYKLYDLVSSIISHDSQINTPMSQEYRNHQGTFSTIYSHITYTITSMSLLLLNFKTVSSWQLV
jgi:hypothetical protein